VEADASAVAVKVASGALVAVIAAPPSLAQALAALGITAEILRAAPA
jgi:hypothetical protein